jgi:hypothetical protein
MENLETPIAEALEHAHASLMQDLRELERSARLGSQDDLKVLRSSLERTRAHILDHFRFEEQNGYMDVVRKSEPRLSRTIDDLAEEHVRMRNELEALIREAAAASSVNEGIRAKTLDWINHVRRHEARENRLVQDVFNLEIGPED